jgi:hypothetical protein
MGCHAGGRRVKHQKRGQDHSYTVKETGRDIRAAVTHNGYHLRLTADVQFEALTDRQAVAVRTVLHNMIDEALRQAATQRHVNIPLFDLPDDDAPQLAIPTQGVNTL